MGLPPIRAAARWRWTLAAWTAAAGLALPALAQGDQASRTLNTANGLLNRGLFELAVPEYRTFLEQCGSCPQASLGRYGLGVSLFRLAQHEPALEQLELALADRSLAFRADAMLLSGHCMLALDRPGPAGDRLEAMVREHAEHTSADDAAALLAEARFRQQRFEDSVRAAALLAERYPDSPLADRTELFRGMSLMSLGRPADAIPMLQKLAETSADRAIADQALFLLARCQHETRNPSAAIDAYRRTIERNVSGALAQAMLGLGQLLHESGESDEPLALAERVLGEHKGSAAEPGARFLRGRVLFDRGQFEAAGSDFAQVLEQPDQTLHDDAAYWSAKCLLRRGQPAEAAASLERSAERFGDSVLRPEMLYDRAVALSRAGDATSAADAAEVFVREYPEHRLVPDALYLRSSSLLDLGEHAGARALADAILERFGEGPLASDAMFVAVEAESLAGRWGRAAEAASALLARFPGDARAQAARFRLGMALYQLGRHAEAVEPLALVSDLDNTEARFRTAVLALGDIAFAKEDWASAERFLGSYVRMGSEQSGHDDALLKLALSMARQDRPAEAIEPLDRLLAFSDRPTHRTQAMFERGQCLMQVGRYDEAERQLLAVVEAEPTSRFTPFALRHLGSLAQRRGDLAASSEYFGRAAASGDAQVAGDSQLRQGEVLLAAGRYEQAQATLEALLGAGAGGGPTEAIRERARVALGLTLSRSGQPARAIEVIEDVLSGATEAVDPPTRHALGYERAWSLRAVERSDDAAGAYRALLKDLPVGSLRAHSLLDLGAIEMDAGRLTEALPVLRELDALWRSSSGSTPGSADAVGSDVREQGSYRLGVAAHRLEQHDLAAEALAQFHAMFPKSALVPSAELFAGESLVKLGRHQQAVEHFKRIVQDHGSSEPAALATLRLGESLTSLAQWQASASAFEAFLQRYPEHPMWYQASFGLGWAMENQNEHTRAIERYRAVVDRHDGPTAARCQFQIGQCLFAQNQLEQAITELLRVDILYQYPQWSAASLFEAGRCFEQLSRFDEARAQYQAVVARFGDTPWAERAKERLERLSSRGVPGRG